MTFKKADWAILREAEEQGLVVAMTTVVERNRTPLNEELSRYFREKRPNYIGSFDEEICDDILCEINGYIKEKNLDMHTIHFPYSSGSDIYLLPIGENIKLKLLVSDEYFGDGEYSKYIMIDFFVINEQTTKQDVDQLIDFIQSHLTF